MGLDRPQPKVHVINLRWVSSELRVRVHRGFLRVNPGCKPHVLGSLGTHLTLAFRKPKSFETVPDFLSETEPPALGVAPIVFCERLAAAWLQQFKFAMMVVIQGWHTFKYSSPRMRKYSSNSTAFREFALKVATAMSPTNGTNLDINCHDEFTRVSANDTYPTPAETKLFMSMRLISHPGILILH